MKKTMYCPNKGLCKKECCVHYGAHLKEDNCEHIVCAHGYKVTCKTIQKGVKK